MTCFWKGIIYNLDSKDLKFFNIKSKSVKNKNILQLISELKRLNVKTYHCTWNGNTLSEKQLQENYDHITNYDIKTINNGYYCSCSDPFLFLLSYLLNINIYHNYNGYIIKYNVNANKNNKTLHFISNNEHFGI